jgi:CBS domain-containing protein
MVKRGISGIPIMDGGKLTGMVTKMEVLKVLA